MKVLVTEVAKGAADALAEVVRSADLLDYTAGQWVGGWISESGSWRRWRRALHSQE